MASSYMNRAISNPGSMSGKLQSSSRRMHDYCRGIHGAARERKGLKKGFHTAIRRASKMEIKSSLDDYQS